MQYNARITGLIAFMLMLFAFSSVLAQEGDDACQFDSIKTAFQQYVQTVDKAQVEKIQGLLNEKAYGPVDVDGVLGRDTRLAFQRVCQAYVVKSSENLANDLVALLENSEQPQASPEPDASPAPQTSFEPEANPDPQTSPETEVNPESEASPVQAIKPAVKAKAKLKPAQPVVHEKGPRIFYRWSASEEEEKSADDEPAEKSAVEQATPEVVIPDDVLEQLNKIQAIAYPNEVLFKEALQILFADSELTWQPYLGLILEQAYQPVSEKPERIQLDGGGCGCSRDFSSTVYGFYPTWLASGEVQTVDFSLFDRIAFYALSLNDEGSVQDLQQWSDASNVAAFIKLAHKHRVNVDVTISATGWRAWTDKVMDNAVRKVASTVRHKFAAANENALLSMLEGSSSLQVGGVTLYFDGYSTSEDNRHNIVSFITKLSEMLRDPDSDVELKLNVMLDVDMGSIEKQAVFKDLEAVLIDEEDSRAPVDYVFVFLQEPTSDSKKVLRRKIEDEFRGAHRKIVLRKMLPVISPLGHQNDPRKPFAQFTDDLVYFQDNFAGVGLWPLPLDSDQDAATIKQLIIELYSSTNDSNRLGDMIEKYAPGLCQFACPNRWLFRLGFDLLIGLLLLYGVLAIWIYRLRILYKRYFLYFMAYLLVIVAVFLISLVCDPFWQERADAVVASVFLVGLVVLISRYVSKATRPPLP